jgi:hypothetical protein
MSDANGVAAPRGGYLLLVAFADGSTAAGPLQITVEAADSPGVDTTVMSRVQVRVNADAPFEIRLTNNGNVDAVLVPVQIEVEGGVELVFDDVLALPDNGSADWLDGPGGNR